MIKYLFANPSIEPLPTIPFCNPDIELLRKLGGILHIGKGYHWQKCIAEPYRITVLSSLEKTNAAAQFNYQHFIRTMAKMIQKYANKIE